MKRVKQNDNDVNQNLASKGQIDWEHFFVITTGISLKDMYIILEWVEGDKKMLENVGIPNI